jgi:ATP-dependent helicase/nuclease subunit A
MKLDFSRSDANQQKAITTPIGKNIIVSASAGSGKTRVLVNRILRECVEEQRDITRILALTFTEAAAAEMKNRITDELNRLYLQAKESGNEEDTKYLETQLVHMSAAHFTTIDSFCLSLLQKYYNVIGMDPAVTRNIVTGGQDEQRRRQGFDLALSELYEENPEDSKLLLEWISTSPSDYDKIYSYYVKPVSDAASASISPKEWYADAEADWKEIHRFDEYPEYVKEWVWKKAEHCIPPLFTSLEEQADARNVTKSYSAEAKQAVYTCVAAMEKAYTEKNYNALCNAVMDSADLKTRLSRGSGSEYSHTITASRNEALSFLIPEEQLVLESGNQARVMHALISLCRKSDEAYEKLKQEAVSMTFADMERGAYRILTQKENPEVIHTIQDSFDEILVDEFQDTSPLQDAIIRAVSKGNNTFRVGDIKQSIYRFRNARPQLMSSYMKMAETDPDHYVHLSLTNNYRSKANIIELANTMFERLMGSGAYSAGWEDSDHSNVGTPGQHEDSPQVKYLYVDLQKRLQELQEKDKEGNIPEVKVSEEEKRRTRCLLTAEKIARLKEAHPDFHWKDFAVLVRSRRDMKPLQNAFEAYGIPYDMNTREGFYSSDLCSLILALAKAIKDPHDDISLLAVLSSEICLVSDEETAAHYVQLRKAIQACHSDGEEPTVSRLKKKLNPGSENPETDESEKLERATIYGTARIWHSEVLDLLKKLGQTADTDGIPAFLTAVSNLSCAQKEGEDLPDLFYERLDSQSRYNFDYLLAQYVQNGINDLSTFIEEVEAGSDEKSSEAVSVGQDDDVVQVATIHGSKGLQYRICFILCRLKASGRAARSVTIDHDLKFGIEGVDLKYSLHHHSFLQQMIREKDDMAEAEESLRLFYVAVTRAEQGLYLVDVEAPNEPVLDHPVSEEDLLQADNCYTRMLWDVMDPAHDSMLAYEEVEELPDPPERVVKNRNHNPAHLDSTILQTMEPASPIVTPSSFEDPQSQVNRTPSTPFLLKDLSFEKNQGSAYGTMMHALCEFLPDHEEWNESLIQACAKEHRLWEGDVPASAIASLLAFRSSSLYEETKDMEIHHEYGFYAKDPVRHVRMNGSMDFMAIDPEKIILIDFKTDAIHHDETFLKRYAGQLNAYRSVLQEGWPDHTVEAWIWSFHNNRAIPVPESGKGE